MRAYKRWKSQKEKARIEEEIKQRKMAIDMNVVN
jgi:hypothetical protein